MWRHFEGVVWATVDHEKSGGDLAVHLTPALWSMHQLRTQIERPSVEHDGDTTHEKTCELLYVDVQFWWLLILTNPEFHRWLSTLRRRSHVSRDL